MAILKCKMCGGTIDFTSGETVGICDFCGTKQTLMVDDEGNINKKAKLFLYYSQYM